ncbi:MAG: ferredoxin [Pseudomonadota bacterium]
MTYAALFQDACARQLRVLGGFHPQAEDGAPANCKTLLLLGPDEPGFWPVFSRSREYQDGLPDPMDRWSRRVIDAWAQTLGAEPLYPFGGPPHQPFYRWALKTGRVRASPINLLVHDHAGLFVSFRGALAFDSHIALPAAPTHPCDSCTEQPCITACPVSALTPKGYDVQSCKDHLSHPLGQGCMARGCSARRACPASQSFGRLPAQSAFHMAHFLE